MSKKKTAHGGKRARSGRKPREEPLVALTVRLKPDVSERLQTLKARLGISHPALIERLLDGFDLLGTVPPNEHEPSEDGSLCLCSQCELRRSARLILGGRSHE